MPEAFGPYTLLEPLGQEPPYVSAYLARSSDGDAVTLVKPRFDDVELAEELVRLFDAMPVFTDPALPMLLDRGFVAGVPYATYVHVPGVPAAALLREADDAGVHLPPAVALEIAHRTALAVAAAHEGFAARCGKPEPLRALSVELLRVSPDGLVSLLGLAFGRLGRHLDHDRVGVLKGEFSFMSPEQVLGKVLDAQSDIFSLGSITYTLLTGARPFDPPGRRTEIEILDHIRRADYEAASVRAPELSRDVDDVLARCFQLHPADRYPSAGELAEALERLLDASPDGDLGAHVQASSAWMAEVERLDRLGVEHHPARSVQRRADRSQMILVSRPGQPRFMIDRGPVSCAEYAAFVQATGRTPPPHWPDGQVATGSEPVTGITYGEALDYAVWAAKRLPSEAEWEAALDAGVLEGLGRIWEWTDTWHELEPRKVVRGGAWRDVPGAADPRNRSFEKHRALDVGFRCALDVRGPA